MHHLSLLLGVKKKIMLKSSFVEGFRLCSIYFYKHVDIIISEKLEGIKIEVPEVTQTEVGQKQKLHVILEEINHILPNAWTNEKWTVDGMLHVHSITSCSTIYRKDLPLLCISLLQFVEIIVCRMCIFVLIKVPNPEMFTTFPPDMTFPPPPPNKNNN